MIKRIFAVTLIVLLSITIAICAESLDKKDYSIASLKPGDNLSKVKSIFKDLKKTSTYTNEIANCPVGVYENKDVKLDIASYDKETCLWAIEVFSSKYPTYRGVKVGDDKQIIIDKYGKATFTDIFDIKGKEYLAWFYEDMKTMKRILFKIDKKTNKIYSISVSMIID